jgi:hypothetical protein
MVEVVFVRKLLHATVFSYKKKVQTPSCISPPSLEIFFGKFFCYILSICTTELFFEDSKKVEFRVETTLLKTVDVFLKNDVIFEKSAILDFWKKKFFLQKLDNKKTLRTQSMFLKSVEN